MTDISFFSFQIQIVRCNWISDVDFVFGMAPNILQNAPCNNNRLTTFSMKYPFCLIFILKL